MKKQVLNFIVKLINNIKLNKLKICVKTSYLIVSLVKVLYREGLVQSFSINCKFLIVTLKSNNKQSFFNIWATNSKKRYLSIKDIYQLESKKNIFIISTIKGFKTSLECKKNILGGRLYLSIK